MRKIGILARVSTEEAAQKEEGSIKNQVLGCRSHIDTENDRNNCQWGKVVDEYIDDGYSGKDLNRPGIRRLIGDIKKRRIDCVVMTEISRMSRNKRDWLDLLQFFQDHGVQFITLRQRFDLTSAMGRMTLGLMIEFSQLEREQTVERVKASITERKKRGLYNGGPIPFGLEATEKKGVLRVSPSKQVLANSMLDALLNEGGTLKATCRIINDKGWFRDCGEPWNFQALAHWIRNPHVAGQVEINSRNKDKDQSKLPENDRYKIVQAAWEPVVDLDKLMRARSLLDENFRSLKVGQWKHHEYILTDLIHCSHDNKMIGKSGHGRSGQKYLYYKHSCRTKCGCKITKVPAVDVEKHVLRELKRLMKSPSLITDLCKAANEKFMRSLPNYGELIRAEKSRVSGLCRQLDKITDEILSSNSADEKVMWRERAYRLHQEKAAIEKQIEHFEDQRRSKPQMLY
jgi:site-specific DNA recombinase